MSAGIEIYVPATRGSKAQVRMPFDPDNRRWLHQAVDTRRPKWEPEMKRWLIPRAAAERVFEAATEDGRKATLTRAFKPDTEKCTEQCQGARLDTVDECTCICGGEFHGQASPGWQAVGSQLLVRRQGEIVTRTRSNGLG